MNGYTLSADRRHVYWVQGEISEDVRASLDYRYGKGNWRQHKIVKFTSLTIPAVDPAARVQGGAMDLRAILAENSMKEPSGQKFFDISTVTKPADTAGFIVKKPLVPLVDLGTADSIFGRRRRFIPGKYSVAFTATLKKFGEYPIPKIGDKPAT